MDPIFIILGAGILGGLVRSLVGWAAHAETNEDVDAMKTLKSVIRASATGLIVAYTLQLDPMATFFAAGFGDVVLKEAYTGLTK